MREAGTGQLGTVSRYVEVPDLSKGRLTMGSIFLHAVDPADKSKQPVPLTAVRQLSRKDDLRYTAIVYNAKLQADADAQHRLQSRGLKRGTGRGLLASFGPF